MISSILLAAGQSKRMLGENKLIKDVKGIPLIKYALNNILKSNVNEIIIILGYQNETIEKLIDKHKKIKFVLNKDFENGMSSSIKVGLNHLSKNTEAFFICLGDMPMINSNIYNQLIKSKNKKDILVPTYNKAQGNPVLFSISMKSTIMSIKGDIGAKKILEKNKNKILKVEVNDINITKDFNKKSDFNS